MFLCLVQTLRPFHRRYLILPSVQSSPLSSLSSETGSVHPKMVAVVVAHPDDETLWAGGTLLSHPEWNCFVVCLCRKSDAERSAKFYTAMKELSSDGIMGDLDDGPNQHPLIEAELESTILELLPAQHYDLVLTHDLSGEYTRHLRHEEVSKAVIRLWQSGKIDTSELWTFAYEDGLKAYYPRAIEKASHYLPLANDIWIKKYQIITKIYGFNADSWEAQTTPRSEAFWQFRNHSQAKEWLARFGRNSKQ